MVGRSESGAKGAAARRQRRSSGDEAGQRGWRGDGEGRREDDEQEEGASGGRAGEGYGMEGEEEDEEQRMLDTRVPQIVNQFFEQDSDQRLDYLQGLKSLLTKQLQKNFEDQKNMLLQQDGGAGQKSNDGNDEEDEDQDMLVNLHPQLIETVLQFIYKIYSQEFEDMKDQCETDSQKNNLKTEDVFDDYDRQAIDDLSDFINWYSQYKMQMTEELNNIQA